MPPPAILDPATLDLGRPIADRARIAEFLPHRHEFALLDAVVLCDVEQNVFAGYVDIKADAWWAKGHIPGRPLFPGVLMVEAAAQLSSYAFRQIVDTEAFLGFTGIDGVKYRGAVEPGNRLIIVGRGKQMKPRRMITEVQGFVDAAMVFEGQITGMPV